MRQRIGSDGELERVETKRRDISVAWGENLEILKAAAGEQISVLGLGGLDHKKWYPMHSPELLQKMHRCVGLTRAGHPDDQSVPR